MKVIEEPNKTHNSAEKRSKGTGRGGGFEGVLRHPSRGALALVVQRCCLLALQLQVFGFSMVTTERRCLLAFFSATMEAW